MGGSDAENNIILISPIDHMIFHIVNYRIFGKWQDAAAAKLLGWSTAMPCGFTTSEETKKKQSKVKQGRKNPMFGRKHTDQAKQKMSQSLLSKKHRLSQSVKFQGVIYPSHRALAKFLNISQAAVSNRIKSCPQKYGYEVIK